MDFPGFCQAVQTTWIYRMMQPTWVFPVVETIHLSAMVLMVGSITVFDLRLLGVAFRRYSVSQIAEHLLPSTWTGFATMLVTGTLLFATTPVQKYCPNSAFRFKLVMIVVAGLNMSVFHFTVYRKVAEWDKASATPLLAKMAGSLSVLLWGSVVVAGRMIGFY